MTQKDKFQVRIPVLGKAAQTVEAEDHSDAVWRVVEDLGRRIGEPPHITAGRLDRLANVKGPTGPAVDLVVMDCVPDTYMSVEENELAQEVADALSDLSR